MRPGAPLAIEIRVVGSAGTRSWLLQGAADGSLPFSARPAGLRLGRAEPGCPVLPLAREALRPLLATAILQIATLAQAELARPRLLSAPGTPQET